MRLTQTERRAILACIAAMQAGEGDGMSTREWESLDSAATKIAAGLKGDAPPNEPECPHGTPLKEQGQTHG